MQNSGRASTDLYKSKMPRKSEHPLLTILNMLKQLKYFFFFISLMVMVTEVRLDLTLLVCSQGIEDAVDCMGLARG